MAKLRIVSITLATLLILAQAVLYYFTNESVNVLAIIAMLLVILSMVVGQYEARKSKK